MLREIICSYYLYFITISNAVDVLYWKWIPLFLMVVLLLMVVLFPLEHRYQVPVVLFVILCVQDIAVWCWTELFVLMFAGSDCSLGKLSSSHAESGFVSMHSLRSSSHSYTSSQQISSRSSQQSAASYMSTESTCNKIWHVQRTAMESNVGASQTQRLVLSSEVSSSQHAEHSVHSDTASSVSPDGVSVLAIPPALPEKTRQRQRRDRHLSTYDNVPSDTAEEPHQEQHIQSCILHKPQTVQHGSCHSPDGKPPPLPLKKKHSECLIIVLECITWTVCTEDSPLCIPMWGRGGQAGRRAVPHYDVPLLTNSLVFVSQCSNQWLTPVSACTPLSPLSVAVSVSSAIFVGVVPLAFCTVLLFVLGEQNILKTWGSEGVAPCIVCGGV